MKSNQIDNFDFIIIGSGPAGEKAAIQASKLNQKVLIIEKRKRIGGTSLHTGSVPSKSLRETAIQLSNMIRMTKDVINCNIGTNLIIKHLTQRKNLVIQQIENRSLSNLINHGIQLFHGTARFKTPHIIEIRSKEHTQCVRGKYIIIATGSRPRLSPWDTLKPDQILNSDSILNMKILPEKITIIGAGVTGCEYACIFANLGVRVNLVSKNAHLLPFLDREISETLTRGMRNHNISIRLEESIEDIQLAKDNKLNIYLKSGKMLTSGIVMMAIGRQANTKDMNLDNIGIQVNKKEKILVNKTYQTSISHIYAVGDVIGFPSLTSTSIIQARTAVLHACKKLKHHKPMQLIPYGIWTIPPISTIGKTEQELTQQNISYEVGIAYFRKLARANILAADEDNGFLKLLFNPKTLKLYGIHIIGYSAPEMIHLGQSVLYHNGDIYYFINSVFNYPTLDEAYTIATLNGLERLKLNN